MKLIKIKINKILSPLNYQVIKINNLTFNLPIETEPEIIEIINTRNQFSMKELLVNLPIRIFKYFVRRIKKINI
jgi:hypothetical protein